MGLFQQMKDLAGVVAVAPELVDEAQHLQVAAAAQYGVVAGAPGMSAYGGAGWAMPTATPIDPADPRLAPIDGLSIEAYARISKAAAAGLDRSSLLAYAAGLGISEQTWDAASHAWTDRMRGDMPLAVHFGNLYTAASV
jgi:hypothetical protein